MSGATRGRQMVDLSGCGSLKHWTVWIALIFLPAQCKAGLRWDRDSCLGEQGCLFVHGCWDRSTCKQKIAHKNPTNRSSLPLFTGNHWAHHWKQKLQCCPLGLLTYPVQTVWIRRRKRRNRKNRSNTGSREECEHCLGAEQSSSTWNSPAYVSFPVILRKWVETFQVLERWNSSWGAGKTNYLLIIKGNAAMRLPQNKADLTTTQLNQVTHYLTFTKEHEKENRFHCVQKSCQTVP